MGQLGHAMPELRRILASSQNAILESNSVLQFVRPDLYVVVLDFANPDMKDSSRKYLDRADALVVIRGELGPPWNVPVRWLESKPRFQVDPPEYVSTGLSDFVRAAVISRVR
jgi:hypothetical protein